MAAPSMSTPVSNLPPTTAAPGNVRHDEDQIVADVMNEMRTAQQKQNAPPPSPPPAHVVQQYVLPTHLPPPVARDDTLFNVLDKTNTIRAVTAAFVALLLFYPESFASLYEKIPTLGVYLDTYDKIVRAILLAVVLYVIMWKLQI